MGFSVLIPCYRSHGTVEHAVKMVVAQLDPAEHQIVILDDADPDGDYRKIATKYGVQTLRNEVELGGVGTHNLGFSIAQHELIHVLHGDDHVLLGFYDAVARAARDEPSAALYAAGHIEADEGGLPFHCPDLDWLSEGGRRFQPIHHGNPLAVAACVIRRSFVRRFGGWDARLCHTCDWLMWHRAATLQGAARVPGHLAVYRAGGPNHTGRLMRTAENLRDFLRLADCVREYAPEQVDDARFRAYVAARARWQEEMFRQRGDAEAEAANRALAEELEG